MNSDQRYVPDPTPGDLYCWIWAAIPPRGNTINVTRAATRFGVSQATIRRWMTSPKTPTKEFRRRAIQLAILRGRGRILWPAPPPSMLTRSLTAAEHAQRCLETQPPTNNWIKLGHLQDHTLLIIHWPRAHAYTASITRTVKHHQRIQNRGGTVIGETTYPTIWEAQIAKHELLQNHQRCIIPTTEAPIGHTDAWIETRP